MPARKTIFVLELDSIWEDVAPTVPTVQQQQVVFTLLILGYSLLFACLLLCSPASYYFLLLAYSLQPTLLLKI